MLIVRVLQQDIKLLFFLHSAMNVTDKPVKRRVPRDTFDTLEELALFLGEAVAFHILIFQI
jgi:hypothetical protein